MQYTVIQEIYFKLEDIFQKKTLQLVRKMWTSGTQISQKTLENTSMEFILDLKSNRT